MSHPLGVDAPDEPIVLPLVVAAERFPELVERHLGTVVASEDPFVARNERGWGAVVDGGEDRSVDAACTPAPAQKPESGFR